MKKILAILITGTLLTGCMFSSKPTNKVTYYDFGQPEKQSSKRLQIGRITAGEEYNKRILLRSGLNNYTYSESVRWLNNPADMVSNYLSLAFIPDESKKLTANIDLFMIDQKKSEVTFVVTYRLGEQTYRFSKTETCDTNNPQTLAKCSQNIIAILTKNIESKL